MAGTVYTYTKNVGNTGLGAITTSQGVVALGQSGLFLPSEYQTAIGDGCVLVRGPASSPASSLTAPTVAAGSSGSLNGAYRWVVTFVTAAGETTAGPECIQTITNAQALLSNIPVGSTTSGVLSRKVYRTAAGGASGTEKLVGTISDNSTTTFTDNVADGSLGASVPTTDTSAVIGGTSPASQVQYAQLTGNPSDDSYPIGAGTGKKMTSIPSTDLPSSVVNASEASFANPSVLGSSARPAVDLLMSAYDTNPAATDHTTAFQSALNAAGAILTAGQASKVRIILDSRLKYTIGGAVQSGANGQLAQLMLPYSQTISGTIEIVGYPGVGGSGNALILGYGTGTRTVIESTLGSAPTFALATGIASTLGGPASFSSNNKNVMSGICLALRNVVFRSAAPVICGVDAGHLAGLEFDGLMFDTDAAAGIVTATTLLGGYSNFISSGLTPCTAPQAIPLVTPLCNCVYGTKGGFVGAANWMCGPMIGELCDIQQVNTIFATGCALNVDVSSHPNKIGLLGDWDNAYGIGSTYPDGTHNAISPGVNGSASQGAAGTNLASQLHIGAWDVQTKEGSAPAALARTNDLLDGNNITPIHAWAQKCQGGTGAAIRNAWSLIGTGSSATGALTRARINDMFASPGTFVTPAGIPPASGTTVRNPVTRDCFAFISGGSVTNYSINGTALGAAPPNPFFLPSCATFSITYTGSPAMSFLAF